MYELRVLRQWLTYNSALILAVIIINVLINVSINDATSWEDAVLGQANSRRGIAGMLVMVGIAPLLNIFFWSLFCRYLTQSIEDLKHQKQDYISQSRERSIFKVNSIFWAAVFFPLLMYPYTFSFILLWGTGHDFWGQIGLLIFAVLGSVFVWLAYFFISKSTIELRQSYIIRVIEKWITARSII